MVLHKFPGTHIFFFLGILSSKCTGERVQKWGLIHQEESQLFPPSLWSYNLSKGRSGEKQLIQNNNNHKILIVVLNCGSEH